MSSKTSDFVRHRIDLDNPPPLTDKQNRELATLATMPDEDIDYSDIPKLDDAALSQFRPLKRQITARIDADVLHWLRSAGSGYQSRMNAILRREMLASLKARR